MLQIKLKFCCHCPLPGWVMALMTPHTHCMKFYQILQELEVLYPACFMFMSPIKKMVGAYSGTPLHPSLIPSYFISVHYISYFDADANERYLDTCTSWDYPGKVEYFFEELCPFDLESYKQFTASTHYLCNTWTFWIEIWEICRFSSYTVSSTWITFDSRKCCNLPYWLSFWIFFNWIMVFLIKKLKRQCGF